MTNPNWLDEERRALQVYRSAPPEAHCPCDWVTDRLAGESQPVYRLTKRKVNCVIHGRNGTH